MCSTDAAMQKQLFSITDSLKTIVNKATTTLTTNKTKNTNYISELKAAYDKAKYDLSTGPANVTTTKKAYIVAKDGELEYEQITKQEAYQIAEKEVLKLIEEYFNLLEMVYTQAEALEIAEEGIGYMDDILLQTISNNAVSEEYIAKSLNDILTNDRKSYYEQDKYDNLKSWNRIWFWIYLFLWVIFSLSLFLTNNEYSQLSIISKVGLIISFIVYLVIAKYIVLMIISFIVFCVTLFPKNVYLQM
jgi:hypothetical protein